MLRKENCYCKACACVVLFVKLRKLIMATNKIKNVLVLGTSCVNTAQFCRKFEEYLLFDSYEQATQWESGTIDSGRSIFFVNNLRLLSTSDVEDTYFSKQIISILSHFGQEETLNAIIILLKPQRTDNVYLWKLKSFLLNNFRQFSDNILYVYALDDKFYEYQQFMKEQLDVFEIKQRNVFEFKVDTFYKASNVNWTKGVSFCKIIYDHIVGGWNKSGLETIYTRSEISNELLLDLINNLMDLLIQIYICINTKHFVKQQIAEEPYNPVQSSNRLVVQQQIGHKAISAFQSEDICVFAPAAIPKRREVVCFGQAVFENYSQQELYISDYKRNATLCHNNDCITFIQYYDQEKNEFLYMKRRKNCHAPCNCSKTIVKNCLVFEAVNDTCIQCKCSSNFHSQSYFKCSYRKYRFNNYEEEEEIARNILATFYLFKEQNGEVLNFEEIFTKFLNVEDETSKLIYETFKKEINHTIESKSKPITNKDIIICLNSLYEIKKSAVIIPKFIEEIFPKDIRFETRTDEEAKTAANEVARLERTCQTPIIIDDETEVEMLRGKVAKLERIIEDLNSNLKQQNVNNLNSELKQDELAAGGHVNLSQNEKGNGEKEVNWNIEPK